ncbi:hypothetical protein KUV50_13730 [Membranicola marinus]|uniref:Natural product n=1 Tax=Membranihabitans marinus TaxID=1227546 RepID=A0A953HWS2_9BACT|nr:hypothetical protein [Membranihabitans marinus]MBY5959208.1 hypothetical protein [Membranihabitans marinus]
MSNLKDFRELGISIPKDQLKMILGGYGGSCGYIDNNGNEMCGLSQAEARHMAEGIPGYYWCCESCASNGGSASYC